MVKKCEINEDKVKANWGECYLSQIRRSVGVVDEKKEATRSEVRKAGEGMAAKEDGGLVAVGEGESTKESIVKGRTTRSKFKNTGTETAEAAAMKKFLGTKEEKAAFTKSAKVIHSPEKKSFGSLQSRDAAVAEENLGGSGKGTSEERDDKEVKVTAAGGERKKMESGASTEAAGADEEDGAKETENSAASEEVGSKEAWRFLRDNVAALVALVEQVREGKDRVDREIKQLKEQRLKDRLEIEEQGKELNKLRNMIGVLVQDIETERECSLSFRKEVEEEFARHEVCVCRGKECVEQRSREGGSDSRKDDVDDVSEKVAAEIDNMSESEGRNERLRTDEENNNVLMQREYLKNVPEALGEGEYACELAERKERRRNIFVRGIRTVGAGIKEELREIISDKTGVTLYIKKVRAIGGGLVIELESMANKLDLMKNKKNLGGVGIWIDDDLTNREKEVQGWLESIGKEERKNGLDVQVGYLKIRVQGIQYRWIEKKGRLEEQKEEVDRINFRK